MLNCMLNIDSLFDYIFKYRGVVMKIKTCCFTGHRKIPPAQYQKIAQRLKLEIEALIKRGVVYFGVGGALGFDTIAAEAVLELRKKYPQIRLILVSPCKTQTYHWSEQDRAIYRSIQKACDKYVCLSEKYTRDCMKKRNRHLVENSAYCICYLTKCFGGTAYTVEYAKKNGLKIVNIADEDETIL